MNRAKYEARFISRKTLTRTAINCQTVLIEPQVVRMIKSLTSTSDISIGGFVNNVLVDHFEKFRPEILEIVNESVTLLDAELKDDD